MIYRHSITITLKKRRIETKEKENHLIRENTLIITFMRKKAESKHLKLKA